MDFILEKSNCPVSQNTFMPLSALSTICLSHLCKQWQMKRSCDEGLDRQLSTCLTTNHWSDKLTIKRDLHQSITGLCNAVCYLIKELQRFFASSEFQKTGPVLLFKNMFWHWYCLPINKIRDIERPDKYETDSDNARSSLWQDMHDRVGKISTRS